MSAALEALTFEGRPLTVVTGKGAPHFIASEVSAALGYEPSKLASKVTGEWAGEFIEGTDFVKLTGPELAAFKTMAADYLRKPEVVDPRAPSLLLLTRDGFNLALIKTRKPAGVRMRRWLVETVLPTLAARQPAPPSPPALPAPASPTPLERLCRGAAEEAIFTGDARLALAVLAVRSVAEHDPASAEVQTDLEQLLRELARLAALQATHYAKVAGDELSAALTVDRIEALAGLLREGGRLRWRPGTATAPAPIVARLAAAFREGRAHLVVRPGRLSPAEGMARWGWENGQPRGVRVGEWEPTSPYGPLALLDAHALQPVLEMTSRAIGSALRGAGALAATDLEARRNLARRVRVEGPAVERLWVRAAALES